MVELCFLVLCCSSIFVRYFWYNEALDASSSIADAGDVNWKLALCLLLAWLVVFITMCKGIKATGKVSHGKGKSEENSDYVRALLQAEQ